MKNLNYLNEFRVPLMGEMGDESNGAFKIKVKGESFGVIASNGEGWEHVSVSGKHGVPSWKVMCAVKEMFFEDDEVAIQIFPKKEDYVNIHPNCLHWWRPINGQEIKLPRKSLV